MAKYDVAVIGAGPGGYVAAIRASQNGFKTVCIDKRETPGGTCLNVGCIPSKCLLYSSEQYAWLKKDAETHGIDAKGISLEFQQLMKRKDGVVKNLVDGISGLFKRNKIDYIIGEASFHSPHTLKVVTKDSEERIEADYFILATGSEPISLPFLPIDEKVILSSTGALELKKIPQKMVVVGAGVIGVECASIYARLGSEVTILEMLDVVCPMMDHEISKALQKSLTKQGLQFYLSAKVIAKKDKTLIFEHEKKEKEAKADVILVSIGRRPYSSGLKLENAGIQTTEKGFVPVDGQLRTVQPHIFAMGDLVEGVMLAHRASEEGIAVADFLARKGGHVNYMAIPNVIYTQPEVASVGMTEKEAQEAGVNVLVGKCSLLGNPRGRCTGETDGFVKVIGDQNSGKLVGMHIMSPHASEMIMEGVIAIENRMTVKELSIASHPHPTFSEAVKEAAMAASGKAVHV